MNSQAWTRGIVTLLLLPTISRLAAGQCGAWDPGFGAPGFGNSGVETVLSLAEFDDGSGPALYAGGLFFTAGGVLTSSCIARWEGTNWSALGAPGSGMNSYVWSLSDFDDGSGPALYAGGSFTTAGGVAAPYIARWNGTNWSALGTPGSGMDYTVWCLAVFDDGSGPALYAGGGFATAGGVSTPNIARWNGTNWSALGAPGSGTNGPVFSLAVFDDGSGPALYAGGFFTTAGGVSVSNIARWNGTSWSALGAPGTGTNNTVRALRVFDDGSGPEVYAGGDFTTAGGVSALRIARWNGTSWSALGAPGSGMNHHVLSLTAFDDGSGPALYAGGFFGTADGVSALHIARWNGSSWSALGSGIGGGQVYSLFAFDDGSGPALYAGGDFTSANGNASYCIAKWSGCPTTPTPYCLGDGSVASCPCGNDGVTGHGCDNSVASGGALLVSSGATSPDTLVLAQSGELESSTSIFLQGHAQIAPVPFGDGLRCVGGSLKRLYVKSATAGSVSAPGAGDPSVTARSAALGDPIAPGSVRHYQVYYRDSALGFCPPPQGSSYNAGNALRVTW